MNDIEADIRLSRNGDQEAFGRLVGVCEPAVRGVLAGMLPDPNMVQDVMQEVFLVVYRRLDTYKPGTNFMAWVRTIARNMAQNERRRWYRRQDVQDRYRAEAERRIAENIEQVMSELPEETLDALRDCVQRLGGRTRSLVDKFYYEQCSINQLSDILKMSASAAKVALHRARHTIGKCISDKGAAG